MASAACGDDVATRPLEALGADDGKFLASFLDRTLPFVQWTHSSHLRMASLQLLVHGIPRLRDASSDTARLQCCSALLSIVAGIQAFNEKHAERLTVGFHWSITEVWFRAVALSVLRCTAADSSLCEPSNSEKLVASVLDSSVAVQPLGSDGPAEPQLLKSSSLLWALYSKAVLFDKPGASRAAWVAPDVGRLQASPEAASAYPEVCAFLTGVEPLQAA